MAAGRAEEWRWLVQRWEKSGLSARRFAEEHGVAPKTLVWWRWRLRGERQTAQHEEANAKQKRRGKRSREETPVAFVRVVAAEKATQGAAESEPALELVLGHVLVRVRRGFDPETLGRVIDVLERRPC